MRVIGLVFVYFLMMDGVVVGSYSTLSECQASAGTYQYCIYGG